jgi:hypothetical protein
MSQKKTILWTDTAQTEQQHLPMKMGSERNQAINQVSQANSKILV